MNCPNCGTELSESSTVCTVCGAAVQPQLTPEERARKRWQEREQQRREKKKQKKKQTDGVRRADTRGHLCCCGKIVTQRRVTAA